MFRVYLAPMEGLADPPLRRVLCRHAGFDWCFTEFIRVTDEGLAAKALLHDAPELENGGRTPDGTPCRVQILGDNPQMMAKAAALAESLGALGVDINFGCPSRFVHHSGSMLLKEPELMHDIVAAVRDALKSDILLSVKIRSGFFDKSELPGIMEAVAQEGVSEVAVHCRTRRELYKKEALDWSVLAPLHELFPAVTIVANGDIVSKESADECFKETLCTTLMIGRGAFMCPNLPKVIRDGERPYDSLETLKVMREVAQEFLDMGIEREKIICDRAKQFLSYARLGSPRLREFFKRFCRVKTVAECFTMIDDEIKAHEREISEEE